MAAQKSGSRTRFVVSERPSSPVALAVFLAAYFGLLFVVFAPEGTFNTLRHEISDQP